MYMAKASRSLRTTPAARRAYTMATRSATAPHALRLSQARARLHSLALALFFSLSLSLLVAGTAAMVAGRELAICRRRATPRLTVSTTSCNVTRHTRSTHPRPRSSPAPAPRHRHGRARPGSRALPAAAAPTARHRHRVDLTAPAAAASVLPAAISVNARE